MVSLESRTFTDGHCVRLETLGGVVSLESRTFTDGHCVRLETLGGGLPGE